MKAILLVKKISKWRENLFQLSNVNNKGKINTKSEHPKIPYDYE
jgi:hypothetical protein